MPTPPTTFRLPDETLAHLDRIARELDALRPFPGRGHGKADAICYAAAELVRRLDGGSVPEPTRRRPGRQRVKKS